MNSNGSGDIVSYKEDLSKGQFQSIGLPLMNGSFLTINRIRSQSSHPSPLRLKRKPAFTDLTQDEQSTEISLLLHPQDGIQLQRKLTGIGDFQSPQVSEIIQKHELQAKCSEVSNVVSLRRQRGCIQIPEAFRYRPARPNNLYISDILNNNEKKNEKLMYVVPMKKNCEDIASSKEMVCVQNRYRPPSQSCVASRNYINNRNFIIFRDQLKSLNEEFLFQVKEQIEENPYALLTETLQQYLTRVEDMGFSTQK